MNQDQAPIEQVRANLKRLLISHLALEDITPEEIDDESPIFGESLGLDSLDAVEVVVLLQRHYGITLKEGERGADLFRSIASLSEFILQESPHPLGDATDSPGATK